jgi:hypothetical protein
LLALEQSDDAKRAMTEAYKSEPELVDTFLEEKDDVVVSPYESMLPGFPV